MLLHAAVKTSFTDGGESHNAILHGEQSVVFAHTDVSAWNDACTALAHDDSAYLCTLPVTDFHTQILRI